MQQRIAIIPARGGSKRIPRKNLRDFCGKPILLYSIEAALGSGCFDEIMVSTDDAEIAQLARNAGASVPFLRSTENAGDYATTADVLLEVLRHYQQLGQEFDLICCIYPTAPFVTSVKIAQALHLMEQESADSLVTLTAYSYPPQRAVRIQNGSVHWLHPEHEPTRSQDLEPIYHDCGQMYWLRNQTFQEHQNLLIGKTVPYLVSELEAQDIDTDVDWTLAELKYRLFNALL